MQEENNSDMYIQIYPSDVFPEVSRIRYFCIAFPALHEAWQKMQMLHAGFPAEPRFGIESAYERRIPRRVIFLNRASISAAGRKMEYILFEKNGKSFEKKNITSFI